MVINSWKAAAGDIPLVLPADPERAPQDLGLTPSEVDAHIPIDRLARLAPMMERLVERARNRDEQEANPGWPLQSPCPEAAPLPAFGHDRLPESRAGEESSLNAVIEEISFHTHYATRMAA